MVERFTFEAGSKAKLIDRLMLGFPGRALQHLAYLVRLSELKAFEFGAAGGSGRAKMEAHDDVVIAFAAA